MFAADAHLTHTLAKQCCCCVVFAADAHLTHTLAMPALLTHDLAVLVHVAYRREVTHQQGKDFAAAVGASFLETSAKDNSNVEEVFQHIIGIIDGETSGAGQKKDCTIL